MNKQKKALLYAIEKGYKVVDGEVFNVFNEIISSNRLINGYKSFNIKIKESNIPIIIKVHRLVAYQKYGDKIFENGIEVRHKDNNKLNNLDYNIILGTHQQNMMDIPKEQRIQNAIHRKYNYKEIKEYYNQTKSYKQTMDKFGINSKGTLNYILKKGC